ncbi:MAG: type II toxin-antitoxin system mRNA interferase toxin, RelE/StbE family [Nitrospirae bacterium]|nr:type II toxin-antitoxin system mRNA interferase toxin, RelE/StbE family [Nitrospirota bacterium]
MPKLVFEKHFMRSTHKLVKNSSEIDDKLSRVLSLLQKDPFAPSLKTHSLSGRHKGKYACSLTYELRIVFKLYDDIVHLLDIGSHDEVY